VFPDDTDHAQPHSYYMKKLWDYGKILSGQFGELLCLFESRHVHSLGFHRGRAGCGIQRGKVFTTGLRYGNAGGADVCAARGITICITSEFQSLKDLVEKSIAFLTIMMVPVLLVLLVLAPFIVDIIYSGRVFGICTDPSDLLCLSILVP